MDIKIKTQYDLIINAIVSSGRPLQRGEIIEAIGGSLPPNQLGVLLNRFIKNKRLVKLKYPSFPAFYSHPDWVHNGKRFDPYTKKFIDETNNH